MLLVALAFEATRYATVIRAGVSPVFKTCNVSPGITLEREFEVIAAVLPAAKYATMQLVFDSVPPPLPVPHPVVAAVGDATGVGPGVLWFAGAISKAVSPWRMLIKP